MAANPSARLRGILWVQGESDALDMRMAAAYGMNLWNLINATRIALRTYNPNLHWIIAKQAMDGRTGLLPYIESVRIGQEAMRWGLKNITLVDMEDKEFFKQLYNGGLHPLHLTKKGACDLGKDMAESYIKSSLS